jgi:Cu/Ag efflux pump CusA
MVLTVVYTISPELPEIVLSGKIMDESHKEIIGNIVKKYVSSFDFLIEVFLVWVVVATVLLTVFKAWWIKLCSEALDGDANLSRPSSMLNPALFLCLSTSSFTCF